MNFIQLIKNYGTGLPYPLGKLLSYVPYDYRLGVGAVYKNRKYEISEFENMTECEVQSIIFSKTKEIAVYAFHNVPFYAELYKKHGVNPEKLSSFDELKMLPLVDKKMFQSVPLEYRSSKVPNRNIVNTGGSSGKPLELYIEPSCVGHEWAHMHKIWSTLGFKQHHNRIVFGGRSNVKNLLEYDSARHHIAVDIYAGWNSIADRLLENFDYYSPKYLHGYPSSIFDFTLWLFQNNHDLFEVLKKNIDGLFLGSEFPSPQIRKEVEFLLDCESVSWYGHTERAALAYEKYESESYCPFYSYGFSEAVLLGEKSHLVATSYFNRATPLIRYDTGDIIEPSFSKNGLLGYFKISEGRDGEFIIDKNQNKIFLTALIFGRHHEIFNKSLHIQVEQVQPGTANIFITPRTNNMSSEQAKSLFDSNNVDIDFSFNIVQEPIKTESGKVPLLIK